MHVRKKVSRHQGIEASSRGRRRKEELHTEIFLSIGIGGVGLRGAGWVATPQGVSRRVRIL